VTDGGVIEPGLGAMRMCRTRWQWLGHLGQPVGHVTGPSNGMYVHSNYLCTSGRHCGSSAEHTCRHTLSGTPGGVHMTAYLLQCLHLSSMLLEVHWP
jgi:hypothetical protein